MGHRLNLSIRQNNGSESNIYLHWGAQPEFINKLKGFKVEDSPQLNVAKVWALYETPSEIGNPAIDSVTEMATGEKKNFSSSEFDAAMELLPEECRLNEFIGQNVDYGSESADEKDYLDEEEIPEVQAKLKNQYENRVKWLDAEAKLNNHLLLNVEEGKMANTLDTFVKLFGEKFKEDDIIKELFTQYTVWNPALIAGETIILPGFFIRDNRSEDKNNFILVTNLKDLHLTEAGWTVTVDGKEYGYAS